jgi:hypothetical protein
VGKQELGKSPKSSTPVIMNNGEMWKQLDYIRSCVCIDVYHSNRLVITGHTSLE